MNQENEVTPLVVSVDDFLMSFNVASGATRSQALVVRGFSLKYKKDVQEITKELDETYKKLSTEQKREIFNQMAGSHRSNKLAKTVLSQISKQPLFDIDKEMHNQLPSDEDFMRLNTVLVSEKIDEDRLNKVLLTIFQKTDRQEMARDLKNLSAYLTLYESTQWWRRLTAGARDLMTEEGKKIYNSVN